MKTTPLNARGIGKAVDFEAVARRAESDGELTEDEAALIAVGRSVCRAAIALAETQDLIGTLAHGTAGVHSPRAVRKFNQILRNNIVPLFPEFDEAA